MREKSFNFLNKYSMATRKTYSLEEKRELIDKYKSRYIEAPRSYIKGEKMTAELFDSLHENEQWHRIYMNYVRKNESKNTTAANKKFSYAKVRSALNTIKNSVDKMSENQLQKTLLAFEEIKQYHEDKKARQQEQKVKELEGKEAQLKAQLEKVMAEKSKLIQ